MTTSFHRQGLEHLIFGTPMWRAKLLAASGLLAVSSKLGDFAEVGGGNPLPQLWAGHDGSAVQYVVKNINRGGNHLRRQLVEVPSSRDVMRQPDSCLPLLFADGSAPSD
jgi:hypothetical protein